MGKEPVVIRFDVSDAIGSGERLQQTAWLFTPDDSHAIVGVLLCLAGGTYDKHYWHLDIPGHPGYSFARYMAARGFVVVALDHLGVGDSTDPHESGPVDLTLLARGDAAVARDLRARLDAGTLSADIPASTDLPIIGVGHSMGACLTMMAECFGARFDSAVLLGYGVYVVGGHGESPLELDLPERVRHSEDAFRRATGTPLDAEYAMVPRARLKERFHADDVPEDVINADDQVESRVPVRAASEVTSAGFSEQFAARIAIPVFLGFGGVRDVSPDPHGEPMYYRRSTDVTVFVLPGSAHCHNFATDRTHLWSRTAAWIREQDAQWSTNDLAASQP